jgi:hypothetical protein
VKEKESTYAEEFSKRLHEFVQEVGESFLSIEMGADLSIGAIYKAVKNKKTIGPEAINKILLKYPSLNIIYLLTGEKKLKKLLDIEPALANEPTPTYNNPDLRNELLELMRENRALRKRIEELELAQQTELAIP